MPNERGNEDNEGQEPERVPINKTEEEKPTVDHAAVAAEAVRTAQDADVRQIATTAIESMPLEDQREVMASFIPSRSVTDMQAQTMTRVGTVLLFVALLPIVAAVWTLLNTPSSWENAPTEGNMSQTVSFYMPILLAPAVLLVASGLLSVFGYLLMRAGFAAAREIIPAGDMEMVRRILEKANPKEAIDEYVRLRSLTGVSGFFTKMNLSGLPLATIALTLIFTLLAIWGDAFFDLAKLTLGVFLGSYVQQNVGPRANP